MMMRKQQVKRKLAAHRMAAPLAVFGLGMLACSPGEGLLGTTAVAQQGHHRLPPVDKFSVVSQVWHRYPGLAVADITFNNENDYAVRNVVISCDFLGPNGNVIVRRGSTIFESFPPASTIKIDGVSFSLREKNATPGSCRVLSVRAVGAPN